MKEELAEILALHALGFVAGDEDILTAYLRLSGMSLENLKKDAGNKEVLGSILDFLLQNEKRLLEFCQTEYCRTALIQPEALAKARRHFPGGDEIAYST